MAIRDKVWQRVGLTLVVIVIVNFSAAFSDDKCRSGCQGGSSQIFKYAPGTTYKYNLEGAVDVSVSSAEGQLTSTKLRGTVLLTALPQCDYLLRLQNVQVIGPDGKKYGAIPGIEKAVRFNFNDGRIEDSICVEHGDNQNSLNIKRAAVSLFQAALKQHHETDIFGVCPTNVETRQDGPVTVITKNRFLNKCAFRENIKQDYISTTFNLNSEIKSSPLLNGDYTSEQRVKNGILDHALVTENYLYLPFSVGGNGAKACVTTKIQFVGTSKDAVTPKCSEPRSIIFEAPHLVNVETSNVDSITTALRDAKNTVDLTVNEHTARAFVNLIRILRNSKKDDILAVYGQVRAGAGFKDKAGTKKVFLDALFRAGTGDTIEVAIELLKNKELTPLEQRAVYAGMAFIKHATLASLTAACALLDQPNLPREGYYSVGLLASRYCQEHNCKNVEQIDQLLAKFTAKLGDGKAANKKAENELIAVIKGLANFENLNDATVLKLVQIGQDKKAANRVRIAVLDAYLAHACNDKIRDSALGILKDIQQDSEIRIKAYLAVAQCPNGKAASALKALLDTEPSYQVGGFIISHLRNLKASASPEKALAKHVLGQISTTNRFPIDLRKYSFNNEFSYAVDNMGLANTVESNVIYSYNSFLPQSVSLNVTADLFGHSFNFLEIGFRQENLNKVLDNYFGPLGVFSGSTEDLVKTGKESFDKIAKHFEQRLTKTRGKRDVSRPEIDAVSKQVQIKTNELNKDVDIDLSIKTFGTELLFLSVSDEGQKFTLDSLIDKFFDELDGDLDKAKNFEHLSQCNTLFIDSELSYPTSIGFALKLTVEGSSSVQVKFASQVDVRAWLNDRLSPLKLTLVPSASVEIRGSLVADAQVIENGISVRSTLYSATGGDLDVQFLEGKGLDVKFALPVENQKLLTATHEIVFNTREIGKPEVTVPVKFGQNKDFNICLDQLSPVLGLTLCIDINNPPTSGKPGTLPFPLSGNGKFSVGITKNDLSHFHYSHLFRNDANKVGAEVVFEAVGVRQDKKLNVNFELCFVPELFIKASLNCPITSQSIEARIINNNQEKLLSIVAQRDNQNIVGKIGFAVSGGGSKTIYKPILSYNGPGTDGQGLPIKLDGTIIAEQNGQTLKYIFQDVCVSLPNEPQAVTIKGHVGCEPGAFFSDISVTFRKETGSLNGRIQLQPDIKLLAEVKNTINPDLNFKVDLFHKRQPHQADTSVTFVHGPDLNSQTNKLTASTCFLYKRKGTYDFEGKTEAKLTYPLLGIDTKFLHAVNPKNIKLELVFGCSDIKIGSALDFSFNQKTSGDYVLGFEVFGKTNKIRLDATREIAGEKSQVTNCLDINGKKIEVNGVITHHSKPDDINVGADLIVKLPGRPEPIKIENGLILNPTNFDTHLKVSCASQVYVDLFFKSNKDKNASGSIKLSLKDVVSANGQLTVKNGVGNGFIVFDLAQLKRKLKAESSFTINEPVYKADLCLYFDFEANNDNKWYFSTNTNAKDEFIESKNVVDFQGKKFELNFKAEGKNALYNAKFVSEFDLTLPSNKCILFKWNRDIQTTNDVLRGNVFASIESREQRNKPGCKTTFKGDFKQLDLKNYLYDFNYNIVSDSTDGNVFNVDITGKRFKQDEHTHYEECLKLSTPYLKHPLEVTHTFKYKDNAGNFMFKSTGGHSAVIQGKYDSNNDDKHVFGEITGDVNFNYKTLKVVRFALSGLRDEPQDHEFHTNAVMSLFVDDDGTNPEATIDYKLQVESFIKPEDYRLKGALNVGKEQPKTIEYGYSIKNEAGVNKIYVDGKVQYGPNSIIKSDLCAYQPSPNEYKLDVSLDAPNAPNNKLQIYTKRSPDNKVWNGEVVAIAGQQKYNLNTELILSEAAPGFNIKFVYPDGKTYLIAVKVSRVTPNHYTGDLKVALGDKDYFCDTTFDTKLESIDNFYIKVSINSPPLQLDNYLIEAQNVPSKTGKRIQVLVKCASGNILSGSTNYNARDEAGKYIVEGSGTFKLYQDTKQGNFKFINQKLIEGKHGEDGCEISFNAGLGTSAIDAEFKATNKQFRFLNSYCEEKQRCANIEIDSKLITFGGSELNHELEVAVDLRKLGLSHEFGLKAQTVRKALTLDHNVDLYFQSKENKYQYSVIVHPKDASATLTTPKRIICLESYIHSVPQTNSVKAEIALYLNKKLKPNEKTALTFVLDANKPTKTKTGGGYTDGYNAVATFVNPALGKDMSVTYTAKYDLAHLKADIVSCIDIFPNPNHKIVINVRTSSRIIGTFGVNAQSFVQVKSEGLKFDLKAEETDHFDPQQGEIKYHYTLNYNLGGTTYDSAVLFEAKPTNSKALLKYLNKDLINVDTQIQTSKDSVTANSNVFLLGVDPTSTQIEVRPNLAKFTVWHTSTPANKLEATATLNKDKSNIPSNADFCINIWKDNKPTELAKWVLHFNPSRIGQSTPKVNFEKIKEDVVTPAQNDLRKFLNELKVCLDGAVRDFGAQSDRVVEELKKNVPNLKPLEEYYKKELLALQEEIISDKTLKEISEIIKCVLDIIVTSYTESFKTCSNLIDKITESTRLQVARLIELYNKEILPEITEAFHKFCTLWADLWEKISDLIFTVAANVDKFFQAHKDELEQLAAIVEGIWKDAFELFYGLINDAHQVVTKEWDNVYNGLKKSNVIIEDLKNKYKQYVTDSQVPEMIFHTFLEISGTIKDAIPIDEVKRLITAITDYVTKKYKNQPCDDVASIQNIITLAAQSAGKIFDGVLASTKGDLHLTQKGGVPTFPWQQWLTVPKPGGIRFSPISYLTKNDLDSIFKAIYAFSLNPCHWLPPYELDALLIQGQHIFTFDNKHITFPGNCNYLLARDAFKGRFTIIGTYTNGILTEITLADKADIITVKTGGQILLNGAQSEFPIRRSISHAYRLYESVNIESKAGVRITCGPQLVACGIHISGYYHGDIRGLLGNADSEPFDDLTLPNGKIVQTEGEFCNSYQVGSNCPAVTVVDHKQHHSNPVCGKWFSGNSPLSSCFNFVKPDNYRQACEHGLAAGIPDTEISIVTGYVASCRTKNVPVAMPKEFIKCTTGEQPFEIGDTFSVKIPRKAADIVLIVDQAKPNEVVFKELVVPLVQQLSTELTGHGITDVDYHVIGFGGEHPEYVSHYTIDGKLTCKGGHLPDVQFTDASKPTIYSLGSQYLDALQRFLQIVRNEIDTLTFQLPLTRAFTEATKYPFRPHAAKAIIGVSSTPCVTGLGFLKLRSIFIDEKLVKISAVLPIDNFNTHDPKNVKNVIGFNKNGVLTFSDARKKPEGDPELLQDLDVNDGCVDFVVKNGGNVFVANNFVAGKPPQRKQFAFVAAHTIANQLVNTEEGLDCECSLVTAYSAANVCKVVFRREKEVVESAPIKKEPYKG